MIIPLIPVHIAGLFANIAAEGRLAATVKMFASLYAIIIVLQLLYILVSVPSGERRMQKEPPEEYQECRPCVLYRPRYSVLCVYDTGSAELCVQQ